MEKGSLSSRAMLVDLSLSMWTARKYDKQATAEVARNHGTYTGAGRYNKNLLPVMTTAGKAPSVSKATSYVNLQKAFNVARTIHYTETLPWSDTGPRLLPATNFFVYSQKMRQAEANIQTCLEDFLLDYPGLVQQAQSILNGLFDPTDYPSVSELRRSFSVRSKILPLPDAEDFRVTLGNSQVEEIKRALEVDCQESLNRATSDLYTRLHTAISHIADRLSVSDAIFRDSLIGNMRELIDLLPRLNLTGDVKLDSLKAEIEQKIACFEPEDLREDPDLRKQVAEEAQRIASDMAGLMA